MLGGEGGCVISCSASVLLDDPGAHDPAAHDRMPYCCCASVINISGARWMLLVGGSRGWGRILMAKPAVLLIGADKGGVGKTMVARTLLDYFAHHRVGSRAFDTEAPRGTLKRFHPEVT